MPTILRAVCRSSPPLSRPRRRAPRAVAPGRAADGRGRDRSLGPGQADPRRARRHPTRAREAARGRSVHGDEPAGSAVVARLRRSHPPRGTALWLIEDVNPDGPAAGTRHNANGVDLNRNFPYRWQPQDGVYESGSGPASEPETQALERFVERERPRVTLWYHQALRIVVRCAGDPTLERLYSRALRAAAPPPARLPRHRHLVAEPPPSAATRRSWSSCPAAPCRRAAYAATRPRCWRWPARSRRRAGAAPDPVRRAAQGGDARLRPPPLRPRRLPAARPRA